MTTKQPATPLPWTWRDLNKTVIQMSDYVFAAHAANAYPRLVEALKRTRHVLAGLYATRIANSGAGQQAYDHAGALLRELGEL